MSNLNNDNFFDSSLSEVSNDIASNVPISNSIFHTCDTDNFLKYFFTDSVCIQSASMTGKFGGEIIKETYADGGLENVYRTSVYTKVDGKRTKTGTVVLIIGTDGAEIIKTHNGIVPKKDEQIILIEKNDGDIFSEAIMRFKQGKEINVNKSAASLKSFINNRYEISDEQFSNLINRIDGTNELNSFLKAIIKTAKFSGTIGSITLFEANKVMDSAIKGFDDFVNNNLKISESFWNPKNKDFKKKVNITKQDIEGITSKLDEIEAQIDGLSFRQIVALGGLATLSTGPFAILLAPVGVVASYQLYSGEISIVFDSAKAQIKSAITQLKEFLNIKLLEILNGVNVVIDAVLAFISGVWSGLVDFVADVIRLFLFLIKIAIAGAAKLTGALTTVVEDVGDLTKNFGLYYNLILENFENMLQGFGAVSWIDVFETCVKGYLFLSTSILIKVFKSTAKTVEGLNHAEWSYYIAYGIIIIADIVLSFFFPALLTTKLAKAGKAGKVLAKIILAVQEAMTTVFKISFKAVGFTIKSIMNVWSMLVSILRKGTDSIKEFIALVFNKLAKVLDELFNGAAKAVQKAFDDLFDRATKRYFKKVDIKPTAYDETTKVFTFCTIKN
ncbi:hypothetical protein [uncultured Psychroserpens sp.]|uniref:hypothetical protein n=1 Tax=uncultured Psychroserpens sp. TaxID=255436 RepID=UPI002623609B|nr:hypothetical protein [uncultured Psychroserpens sp.]